MIDVGSILEHLGHLPGVSSEGLWSLYGATVRAAARRTCSNTCIFLRWNSLRRPTPQHWLMNCVPTCRTMQTTVEQEFYRNLSPQGALNLAWLRRRVAALPVAARHYAFVQPSLPDDVVQAVRNSAFAPLSPSPAEGASARSS